MAQISLYVNDAQLKVIKRSARQAGTSISKWAVDRLVNNSGSAGYSAEFLELFGSIKDDTFIEPAELDIAVDAAREVL